MLTGRTSPSLLGPTLSKAHQAAVVPGAEILRLRPLLSLLLVWMLVCQTVVPPSSRQAMAHGASTSGEGVQANDGGWLNRLVKAFTPAGAPLTATVPVETAPDTLTDAVISRQHPNLNSGRIEGTLRVLAGQSFSVSSNSQLTSDLYLAGAPTIQLSGTAQHGGVVNAGGAGTPANYTVTLANGVNMPGRIFTHADAAPLPADFPASVPAATGSRSVSVNSQSGIAAIGDWQTVRDLSVSGNGLTINVPPGNYGTFTVNGNSRLNFTAGAYNFANTFNLDGSASIQATGLVVVNVAQSLTLTSGALVPGSYTSPGDVRLNVLGASLNINGSSQVTGLVRAYNGTAAVNGTAQVRGQVIANTVTLNGGKVIGAVWPARSGGSMSTFGPRRFDRTTGPPNQYLEQFSLPAGVTSPYTLHIQNGSLDGTNRVSSATVKLNGIQILSPSDLNQNVAGLDRTVTLNSINTLEVKLASVPGSYLIINIGGALPPGDTTPPTLAITSPADSATTTDAQITVSGTASDSGGSVAHVYVNGQEATYNPTDSTWTIANVPLNMGANTINVQAVDQAGNQATANITVTRGTPNQPPTVNAGTDQTLALPTMATLHGSASDDGLPQGSSLVTAWTMVSGPGTVTFANPNALDTSASFSLPGTYVLRLTADDSLLTNSDDATITVQPQNQPPTVVAGPDQTIAMPHAATLNGSATDDGLPAASILSVTWNQVSGPGTATFAEPTLAETTATFSEPGSYVLRLSASDSDLSSSSELTVTVQPANQAPTVNAGPDQIVVLPAPVLLNGSAADDGWPAGSSLTEAWTVVSGPATVNIANPNATVTMATFSMAGTYVLRLTASDGELSNSNDLTVIVDPQNQAPLVDAGPDHTITLPDQSSLYGEVSDDGWPRNSSMTVSWSQLSGPGMATFSSPATAATNVSFNQAGTYTLRLTASDGALTASDDVAVTVIPENHGPTADAGADQTIALPANANLNGSASDDGLPAGSTLATTWTKVSGPGVVTFGNPNVTVTAAAFSAAGTYVLRFTASDSELTRSDDVEVVVIPENHAPTADAGSDQTITLPNTASLNGIPNDDGLPTGSTLSIAWTKVSGSGLVAFSNPNAAATTASFDAAGTYVLRLTASDSQLSTSDDVQVTVIPENLSPTANAGADQTIALPNTANLNGAVSDDGLPAGSSVTSNWSKLSGPGTVTFGNPGVTVTTASFSEPGTYLLRLTASDSELSNSDEVTVTVNPGNQSPIVNAGTDQTITLPAAVSLLGLITDDGLPAGSSVSATWSKASGPGEVTFSAPTSATTTATFTQAGVYELTLTASDSELSASDTLTVTVEPPVNPPTADFAVVGDAAVIPLTVESYSSQHGDAPAIRLVDNNVGTAWRSGSSMVTNQYVKFRLPGDEPHLVDRVRLQTFFANANVAVMVKNFEIQVSEETAADADFTPVFSGTYANTGKLEEFVFSSGPAHARYIKFIAKNNYGAPGYIEVATFEVSSAGSADSIISLSGQNNAALDQGPALLNNGAEVVDYSYTYGLNLYENSANKMLEHKYDTWSTANAPNQYATIKLAGGKEYLISGVKIGTWHDQGYGRPTALKDFEVWVSDTTADAASFTKVLTASAVFDEPVQNFIFPGGPVPAKYVKHVPLTNHGGGNTINTLFFDVIVHGTGGVVAASGQFDAGRPAEAMLDGDVETTWLSRSGVNTNQWVKIALADDKIHKVYGVRIYPSNTPNFPPNGPKDFEVRVSTTTTDDAAFTTVYTGTLTSAAGWREILLSQTVDAKHVQFYWINSHGQSYLSVKEVEVLAFPDEGATLLAYSSQNSDILGPLSALDIDSVNRPWITGANQNVNQFLKLRLPRAELWTIDRVALRPGWLSSGATPLTNMSAKDFDIQISTTNADDASFSTIYSGTLSTSDFLQYFGFPPVQARYVRLLIKNNYGGTAIGLKSFYVFSGDFGGTTARFRDKSTDSDGQIVSYLWDFGDGGTSTERDPEHAYAAPGVYTVTLTVTDDRGLQAQRQHEYRAAISPLNAPISPILADFTLTPRTIHEGQEYVYLYNQSSHRLGPFAARHVDFGDGSYHYFKDDSASGQDSTYHHYQDSGTYQVKLRIGDERFISYSATKSLQVINLPPAVDIPAGKTVVWNESWTNAPVAITDPSSVDQTSLRCNWSLGDGRTTEVANCNRTNGTMTNSYSHPGVYTATLMVTDKDGGSSADTATYIVNKRKTGLVFLEAQADESSGTYLMRTRLTDNYANVPLAGKTIVYALNGATTSATTDANGVAQTQFTFAPGTPITLGTASFFEEEFYLESGSAVTNTPGPSRPQTHTRASSGTDFWLTFPGNFNLYCNLAGCYQQRPLVKLFISAPHNTTGTVTVPGLGFTQAFSVQGNAVTTVSVNDLASLDSSDLVENKGIHVTSQAPVTVYGLSDIIFTSDAFLGLPTNALGTEYIALGYKNGVNVQGTQFAIVAAENATTVTITPSIAVGSRAAHVPYTVTLNQGQTYQLRNDQPGESFDLSGTIITADKPLAVFGGHKCGSVPHGVYYANYLVEQLPPTNTWGQYFVTVPFATRLNGDTFRFLARHDGTRVYVNGVRVATLNRGQLHEQIIAGAAYIVADQPILVAQYANGMTYDSQNGDPMMMLVPPYEQFGNSYTITTTASRFNVNYLNVVAPSSSVGAVMLDGAAIPAGSFTPIGNSGFSGAQVTINLGTHNLSGPEPFGTFVYGFAITDGYSYPGGMNLTPIVRSVKVTLAPATAAPMVGTEDCTTATVTDQNDFPLGGKQVAFSVTGVNPTTQSVTTNASGLAQFCYTGANTGGDVIVATVENATASAARNWRVYVPNQAPVVNAGADQTITLPAPANLPGSASDDGLPANTLNVSWAKVSGPGNVTFGNSSAAATTAAFDAAGVYVLRLTASDTEPSSSDDLQITVNPVPANQPPTANAGPDQTVALNANLITNAGNEDLLAGGEIPGWTEVQATTWARGSMSSGSGFPAPQRGAAYFYSGNAAQAELRQDVDVSAYAASIATGTQQFEFKAHLRSLAEALPDAGRVVVEYRNATNQNMIASLDSGDITSTSGWQLTEDTRVAPVGTGWIRVRLITARNSSAAGDASNDAFFDSVSLRPVGAAAVKLSGTVTDDGLPYGSSLTATWNLVSGPGAATFATPNAAVSGVSFNTAGTYVLRLTASDGDGEANRSDDVTVIVNPANQPPVANAGASQTITLPASASLNGNVNDDGQPPGSSVSVAWTKVSGPGVVTFANANQATTTASFSAAGTYVLRLTADDTEYGSGADVTIAVNPEPTQVNQPPAVNPGPNQTIALPTDTVTLNGIATDDGLPAGSTLTVTWTKISGPGTVTFGNANNAVTTAQFSAVGSYVLRLSASDGAYLVSADVGVILTPENQSPTANAGADQTTLLSQGVQLNGSASDDGLPAGNNLTTTWTKVSGPGTVTFMNPNVMVTGAQFSAIGTYILRLTANDSALSAIDELTITVNDNVAPPTVEITAPTDGSSVTEPANVTGSVSGGAWQLQYSLASDDNTNNRIWTTFASGNGAVTNGQLGILDPTMMLNGLFTIQLSATDSYGQTSLTSISVIVEKNLKVGNFSVSFSDLNIPVAGVPMEVTRTYDTRDKRVGDFGFGWTLGLRNIRVEKAGVLGLKWYETVSQEVFPNYCLEPVGSHAVTVTFPGGKVFKFKPSVTPHCQRNAPITSATIGFTPMPGTVGKLEVIGSSDVQIDGSVPGPVNLIGFGGGVDIFNSFVFRFTAEDGTAYIIDQRSGLQSIADLNGNTLTIGAGGILHSNGKSIVFNRDIAGRITSIVDPNGNSMTYAYDPNGDLVSYTDNENNTSTYTYDANHRLLTIQDPRGIQPIRNEYDADGRLISHTDGFGKIITYVHNLPARTETITDRLGHPTVFTYDERGNVLTKTDARGGVTTFTYDANDNVLTETNALGKTTTYTYDANDHRTSITDPLNNVTQFTYNALGKLLTTTDPLNHVTTNTYNGAGNLLTTKDPLNNVTTYAYSVFDGQMISMTDALNNITRYEYTSGYLTKQTDALNHETTFTYDANGNRATQTVKRTNAQGQLETITTTFEYDKENRLKKTTFADGSFTRIEYNSIGQQSATIDQLGRRTEFTYDDMGRLIKTTYADSTFEETTYDAEGRRLTSKDRAGQVTSYTYDELGRLTRTTFADGTFTTTSYDAISRISTSTDARGNVTTYEYDPNCGCSSRQSKVTDSLGHITTFHYDASGNKSSMTDALGHATTYEYDANNRLIKTTYQDSTFDSVGYDAMGRTVSKTDQAGKTTGFTYDALGRLTIVKDALNQETTFSYDELGQQVSQTDALNRTTRYEYDSLGRRTKRILPAGQSESYTYFATGRPQSKTDFNGNSTTFTYDAMNRLIAKVPDPSLNQPTVTFSYTATGQRLTMNDAIGTTHYNYDNRNRLIEKQTPQGTLTYTYDSAGNLATTRSSNTNGASLDYGYDLINRLATVKDNALPNGANTTNYTYDNVGSLQSYSYPNAVVTSLNYDTLDRLRSMTIANGSNGLAGYNYTLGPAGNRTGVTEANGRSVTFTHDNLYRLTGESISADPQGANGSISYTYDPVGNRLSRVSTVSAVPSQSSSYDANDRLTNVTFDNNGNTTSSNNTTYAYDYENRLKSVGGGAVSFAYDGDGNRVAKSVNGVTTRYLVDTNNPTGFAQVVDEITGNQVTRTYSFGHHLISQRQLVSGQWQVSFYGYDASGSVRLLTDITGAQTDAYTYDAFGNLISVSGSTPNEHLFAGEQFDANVGFYYLRARYMNPAGGRFWTMDSYEGTKSDPLSLHKYLYAGADPVNKVDPSGLESSIGLLGALGGRNTISAMAVMRFIGIGIATVESVCFADIIGTSILREEGFDVSGATPCTKDNSPRITLHRGVNLSHPGYPNALLGIVKPNRRWWQFWKLSPATPFEHNTMADAAINSVFTSWTLNPLVAENYALRDRNDGTISYGVVLTAQIPMWRTFPSPDLHTIQHPISKDYLPEQELLVRGVIRNAKVRMVP